MNQLVYYVFPGVGDGGGILAVAPTTPIAQGTGGAGPSTVFTIQMTTLQAANDRGNS